MKNHVKNFFNKVNKLESGQWLQTTFGGFLYKFIKNEFGEFELRQYNGYRKHELLNYFTICTPNQLETFLNSYEGKKIYADDAFGRGFIHINNYISFLEAFKVETIKDE